MTQARHPFDARLLLLAIVTAWAPVLLLVLL